MSPPAAPDPDVDSARPLTFAIVCLGRVGSEHLRTLLDSHREIHDLVQAV